jgi:hypothetical protein
MPKNYDDMREAMELQEVSLGRAGSTLFFAAQVRNDGKRLEQIVGKAKGDFKSAQMAKTMEDKIDKMADGMTEISNAIFLQRKMIGHLTGLGLSTALTSEKSDKQMKQLLKGRGRR